jgi:capsular polysaccharide biosynthesis protein
MKSKKLIIGLGILCLNAVAYAQVLQVIVVEKYYQATTQKK